MLRFYVIFGLACFFGLATPTGAQTSSSEDPTKQIEFDARLQANSPAKAWVLIQNLKSEKIACGWLAEPMRNGSFRPYLFLWMASDQDSADATVMVYRPVEDILENSGQHWRNLMVLTMCEENGYLPSPEPVGEYGEIWLEKAIAR